MTKEATLPDLRTLVPGFRLDWSGLRNRFDEDLARIEKLNTYEMRAAHLDEMARQFEDAVNASLASKDATIERLQDEVVNLSSIVATCIDDVAGAALDDADATIERLEGEVEAMRDSIRHYAAAAHASEAELEDAVKALEPFAAGVEPDPETISGWRFGIEPKPEDFYRAHNFIRTRTQGGE